MQTSFLISDLKGPNSPGPGHKAPPMTHQVIRIEPWSVARASVRVREYTNDVCSGFTRIKPLGGFSLRTF